LYYEPVAETAANLRLMRKIDEQYLHTPFYGSRQMMWWLRRQGYVINRKRVQRLMRCMGLEAIYPKPRTTVPGAGHKVYPYLLRNLEITRPNQVWGADITYVPLAHGYLYLVAILDWYSRYVVSWRLSNSLRPLLIDRLPVLGSLLPRPQGQQFLTPADRLRIVVRLFQCRDPLSQVGGLPGIGPGQQPLPWGLWLSLRLRVVALGDHGQ